MMKPACFAPVYIGSYPKLAEIARSHGYAMAVHGTLARDMDLICIPWTKEVSDPQAVVDEITTTYAFEALPGGPHPHEHGRLVFTLIVSFGECFIDLSFMPRAALTDAERTKADSEPRNPIEQSENPERTAGGGET